MNKKPLLATAAVASVSLYASQANAMATGVTDALTSAGTDAAVIGAAVLIVFVGIFAFKILRKTL